MSTRAWPARTRRGTDTGTASLVTVIVAGVAATLLMVPLLITAATSVISPGGTCGLLAPARQPAPAAAASAIPASYLALYQQAGRAYNIPWTILAAIGEIESGHGANDGPSSAGALGPMQFMPTTWAAYGHGGNIYNPADAIPAAARYLAASGAHSDIRAAIFAYNHSWNYVTSVLNWASTYAAGGYTIAAAQPGGTACPIALARQIPSQIAARIIAYALAQVGKPYQFSWGAGGELMFGSRVCPAQKADVVNASGATGVVQAGLDFWQRCVAVRVILFAAGQLGKPYQWGATGPDAFDCSGLVMMAYRAAGVSVPRTSQEQWAAGPRVPPGQQRPGDLVFFAGSDGTPSAPGHVGLLVSTSLMVDAPSTGMSVRLDPVNGEVGFTRPG